MLHHDIAIFVQIPRVPRRRPCVRSGTGNDTRLGREQGHILSLSGAEWGVGGGGGDEEDYSVIWPRGIFDTDGMYGRELSLDLLLPCLRYPFALFLFAM